jgi:hypothetical protein
MPGLTRLVRPVAPASPVPPPPAPPTAATPTRPLSAAQKRAEQPWLVATWSLAALWPHLPLPFPVADDLPPSPKPSYRSTYPPPDPAGVPDPATWAVLSDFELALALIDFSPLERRRARMYRPSARGQVPFHPVSLRLAVGLRRELDLGWRALARLLAGPHGAGWRRTLGFTDGQTPSASGLRYFWASVGADVIADLCPRFIALLRAHGLCPERSTFPGDPPEQGVTVSQDGMLHPARSRPSCLLVTDACYQPLPVPDDPASADAAETGTAAATGRPCRAREQEREGCACTSPACHQQCVRASHRDPEARFIHYAGRDGSRGTDVFGYRSVAERLLDDRVAVAWTVTSGLYPANTDERTIFVDRVQALTTTVPDLPIGEWLDDAGVGYGACLDAVWQLGALRMIDIRADPTDRDPAACSARTATACGPTATTATDGAPSTSAPRPAVVIHHRPARPTPRLSRSPTAPSSTRPARSAASSTSAAPSQTAPAAWPARSCRARTPGTPATAAATSPRAATANSRALASSACPPTASPRPPRRSSSPTASSTSIPPVGSSVRPPPAAPPDPLPTAPWLHPGGHPAAPGWLPLRPQPPRSASSRAMASLTRRPTRLPPPAPPPLPDPLRTHPAFAAHAGLLRPTRPPTLPRQPRASHPALTALGHPRRHPLHMPRATRD